MTATLPLWLEHGTDEDAALLRAEEAALIKAGEDLLRRMEAQKVRDIRQIIPHRIKLPDYAI